MDTKGLFLSAMTWLTTGWVWTSIAEYATQKNISFFMSVLVQIVIIYYYVRKSKKDGK